MISLAVLVLCCAVTTICVFLIILTARSQQKKAARKRQEEQKITAENSSCNSVKLKNAKPSPEGNRGPINEVPYYGGTQSDEDGGGNAGVIFVDSNRDSSRVLLREENAEDESASLLTKSVEGRSEHGDGVSVVEFGLGIISEATGLWYRDTSGRHLMRFMILLLLLVLSSFMVSWGYRTFEASL